MLINSSATAFSRAFAPWKVAKYADEDRVRSLCEIMKSAAELGVWLFAQPCTYEFRWAGLEDEKVGVGAQKRTTTTMTTTTMTTMVIAPALVKVGDERGRRLGEGQVMVEWVTQRV